FGPPPIPGAPGIAWRAPPARRRYRLRPEPFAMLRILPNGNRAHGLCGFGEMAAARAGAPGLLLVFKERDFQLHGPAEQDLCLLFDQRPAVGIDLLHVDLAVEAEFEFVFVDAEDAAGIVEPGAEADVGHAAVLVEVAHEALLAREL